MAVTTTGGLLARTTYACSVTAAAYAGRIWTSPTAPPALLTVAGVVAVLAASAVAVGRLLPGAGRRVADVVK